MTLDPASVPTKFIESSADLHHLQSAVTNAERVAIDTEVPISGPGRGELRVMSVAARSHSGIESAFVVDVRDMAPALLGPILTGIQADAWNASFDARVLDRAVWGTGDTTTDLSWWDAQLADALIHQGRSGFTWFHGLAWATAHYLGFDAFGKGTVQLSYTASDDLTSDQIRYAAADAVETLWVSDAIRTQLAEAGLEEISEIEMRARPFLDQMERTGLPFDWPGWERELSKIEQQRKTALDRLSWLTGGGQGTLFDQIIEPTWNPASDRQVRHALNRWAIERVKVWTEARSGESRQLDESDSVDASVLREIGGELCESILEFRHHSKILTTYGESIRQHVAEDGRLHPQYLQVVGTNTGRLASRNPNAQNLSPSMLPYIRPADPDRVFVHADLSQAELRYLAQIANDEPLRAAFARGDDVHASTAASMFGFDPEELSERDPSRFAHLRQIAKALNFGIAYGSGAAALSRSLTAEGSPTTVEEASELLVQYRRTYPGTAAWAEARVAEIQDLRETAGTIDWRATMRLARGFPTVSRIKKDFRRTQGRWPSIEEIVDLHPDRIDHDRVELTSKVRWLSDYPAPVALVAGGLPFMFCSRTVAGRRQQFNLHLDRLFLVAIEEAARSDNPDLRAVRRRFEAEHGVVLYRPGIPSTHSLERTFEDRALRRAYIEGLAVGIGTAATDALLTRAASERIAAMVNAWRNAPVQGGVADIMLVAYADLHHRLRRYDGARPVQTVHDSVVVECWRSDAGQIASLVRQALEQASLRFCPDVAPKADADIRTTLSDGDVVELLGQVSA